MSNEKTDEFLSWRGRLAPPDALPDHGLDDKELSWERLAERLREKPRRRTGYWIAAACLLLALIPATHFFRDRPARLAGRHALNHPSAIPKITVPKITVPKITASHTTVPQTAIPQASVPPRRHRPATLPPSSPRPPAPTLPVLASTNDHSVLIAEAAPPSDTAARLIAQPAASRKQWRVVQINEISNSAGPAPTMATRFQSSFRIGLGVPESGPSDNQPSQPGKTSLLIIKLSSQNR